MSKLRFVALVLAAMTCFGEGAFAAASEQAPRRIALLIGNWDYNLNGKYDTSTEPLFVSDLKNPCHDTGLVKHQLANAGFTIFEHCNLDKPSFDRQIDAFGAELNDLPKGSVVFVYYSGHGMQVRGRTFTVPVRFQMDREKVNTLSDQEQFQFFERNTNNVSYMLQKLTDDTRVALVVALDNCRDGPVDAKVAFNEAVSIRTGPNTLIQYATTAGDRAPDNSQYAMTLSEELGRGGDIGDIMARVGLKMWKLYDNDRRDSYAETNVGPAFAALKFTPLKINQTPAPVGSTTTVNRKKTVVRNIYDGVSLDILWCEGEGENERFALATSIAQNLSRQAKAYGVGRIQLKPLSVQINEHGGYNVHRNLMRYDVEYPKERELLVKIAGDFPEASFLPQRGVGMGGKPTVNYVSAFICGRVSK